VQLILKGIDRINKAITWGVILMFGVMAIVIIAQVIYRFVLKASLPWSEELARYLMVWVTFLGAGVAVRTKGLIAVEAIVNLLPSAVKKAIYYLVTLLSVGLIVIMIYFGFKMTGFVSNQLSAAMQISMAWAYSAIPVGAIVMLMNTVAVIIEEKGGQP
jgi:TRAP-type C4-dicarboxylate transport system permease small subunit